MLFIIIATLHSGNAASNLLKVWYSPLSLPFLSKGKVVNYHRVLKNPYNFAVRKSIVNKISLDFEITHKHWTGMWKITIHLLIAQAEVNILTLHSFQSQFEAICFIRYRICSRQAPRCIPSEIKFLENSINVIMDEFYYL